MIYQIHFDAVPPQAVAAEHRELADAIMACCTAYQRNDLTYDRRGDRPQEHILRNPGGDMLARIVEEREEIPEITLASTLGDLAAVLSKFGRPLTLHPDDNEPLPDGKLRRHAYGVRAHYPGSYLPGFGATPVEALIDLCAKIRAVG